MGNRCRICRQFLQGRVNRATERADGSLCPIGLFAGSRQLGPVQVLGSDPDDPRPGAEREVEFPIGIRAGGEGKDEECRRIEKRQRHQTGQPWGRAP